MAWTNQPLILFHGCAASALQPVNPGGIGTAGAPHNIQLPLCRPLTDFGRGFYTTTYEHQAKQWATPTFGASPHRVLLRHLQP